MCRTPPTHIRLPLLTLRLGYSYSRQRTLPATSTLHSQGQYPPPLHPTVNAPLPTRAARPRPPPLPLPAAPPPHPLPVILPHTIVLPPWHIQRHHFMRPPHTARHTQRVPGKCRPRLYAQNCGSPHFRSTLPSLVHTHATTPALPNSSYISVFRLVDVMNNACCTHASYHHPRPTLALHLSPYAEASKVAVFIWPICGHRYPYEISMYFIENIKYSIPCLLLARLPPRPPACSPACPPARLPARLLACPSTRSLAHPPARPLACPPARSPARPLARSLTRLPARSPAHPLACPLARPLTWY
ncbi:hypothetical protein C8J57DRAFT_1680805 [Mycena rebaudengoi]|nr:hypothetical protein C8J57DRAFT_1680805 [Mycena rebaudengoi]